MASESIEGPDPLTKDLTNNKRNSADSHSLSYGIWSLLLLLKLTF